MKSSLAIATCALSIAVQAPAWALTTPQTAESVSSEEVPAMGSGARLPTTNPPPDTQRISSSKDITEQGKPISTIAVMANPIALLFNMFNVDVGFAVAEKTSANVSANYSSFEILGIKNTAWGARFRRTAHQRAWHLLLKSKDNACQVSLEFLRQFSREVQQARGQSRQL